MCSVHLSAGVVAETVVRATCHYSLHIAAIITAAINSTSTPHRGSLRHCRGRLPTFAQVRFGLRRPMQLWILSIGTCGPATSSEGSDLVLHVLVLANLHCRRLYPPCPSDPGIRCPSICVSYTSLAGFGIGGIGFAVTIMKERLPAPVTADRADRQAVCELKCRCHVVL